jgi:hypothetical protein
VTPCESTTPFSLATDADHESHNDTVAQLHYTTRGGASTTALSWSFCFRSCCISGHVVVTRQGRRRSTRRVSIVLLAANAAQRQRPAPAMIQWRPSSTKTKRRLKNPRPAACFALSPPPSTLTTPRTGRPFAPALSSYTTHKHKQRVTNTTASPRTTTN